MRKPLLSLFLALAALSLAGPVSAQNKLIALTFDDGPRPYILYGADGAPGLLNLLDQQHVKATFFVMGWRLTPKTWGEGRYEKNIGITCLDAAHEAVKRGHEIENHTYSHAELKTAERKWGEAWVLNDVERGAKVIEAVTGHKPVYVRPPDWILPDDARHDLEARGYRILTISQRNPVALRDVNSTDYLCAGKGVGCPKPSLAEGVLRQIEQREKRGVTTHLLAFHELKTTVAELPALITALKAKGYRFVTVSEYMKAVKN